MIEARAEDLSMKPDLLQTYDSLYRYCEDRLFAGWDPFDGLNSRIFQATPLRRSAFVRLAWQQLVKRSPVNLRPILMIPKDVNAKAIALFAAAEFSRFRATKEQRHQTNATRLVDMLRGLSIVGTNATGEPTRAFGYNFDWQSRVFYAPKGTPTIVPTAFAARAFVESFELFGDENDLNSAIETCRFILNDLDRPFASGDEICFSYKPKDSSIIYNASLLAGETLAAVGAITANTEFLETAERSMRFVLKRQKNDGSWLYGPGPKHQWIDNFHTAFVLSSLDRIARHVATSEAEPAIRKGISYWIETFFLDDGSPRYFDHQTYPIDVHSAGAAVATLAELSRYDERALPLSERVADRTAANMRDREGFFYYQKRRSGLVKTPFIRWAQAWMAFGIARLLEAQNRDGNGN